MKNKILICLGVFMAVCVIALNCSNLFAAVMSDTDFDTVITNFETKINNELKEKAGVTTLENPYDFSRTGELIEADIDGKTTNFKYDFTTDYTFYKDITYTKDMTYNDSMDAYEESSMPMYGFLMLSTNKGYKALDSLMYMTLSLLDGLNFSSSNVVDPSTITNGIGFVNAYLNQDTTIDKELFTFKSTKISESADEIVIRNSVTVKYDEDFSGIEGLMASFENNSGSNNQETPNQEENVVENTNNTVETNTATQPKKEWPKAGIDIKMNNILAISIGVAAVALVTLTIKKKNTIKE